MKKTLLFLIAGLISTCLSAQITLPKTWDFGNDTATWPLSSGTGVPDVVIDQLGLYANASGSITNMGAVTANSYTFSDGYSTVNRLQLNGAGYSSGSFSTTPTQRYLYFDVTGTVTIKLWFRSGNSNARTMFITDGTNILAQATTDTASTGVILTAQKTTAGTQRIYVYGDAACNLYKLEVAENTTMGTVNALQNDAKIFAVGNQVNIQGLNSQTEIAVYTMNGALVKTASAKSETSFTLKPGVYIVNAKSEKGVKSQKVMIK